ncbi:MAG: radical SAM protein [Candidatus Hydrogenedentota bacterium]
MKVVVANSVGIDYQNKKIIHSPSRWTNSTTDLNFFTYYPWELAYCSSLLKRETDAEVKFIDGCLEKLDHERYFQKLISEKPDYLVMESSTRTINEDLRLALRLKKIIGTKLIFCGQHPTVFPDEVLKGKLQPRKNEDITKYDTTLDFVCQGEYEETVVEIVKGVEPEKILGLYPNPRRLLINVDNLPLPEDEDVQRIEYAYPNEPSCEYIEIQAYATRGCPFNCSFCVCRNIYYHKPNWRPRKVDNIIYEIQYLKNKYPMMEGIFFDEEIHNGSKKFVIELTDAIKRYGLNNLHYNAMCAYWNMDKEMLEAFKSAGYYLLRIGIETASDVIAKEMRLGVKFNLNKLYEVLKLAKEVGIDMYGTFTFGGQGSTLKEDTRTLDLIYRLISEGLLRRIQMSINTPQPGTSFYNWADKHNYIISKNWDDYDGGNNVVIEYPHYKRSEIEKVYSESFRRYDQGMIHYWAPKVDQNIDNLLKKLPVLKKVLILRTSRIWHFNKVLGMIKTLYPDSQVYVLTSKRSKNELVDNINITRLIVFDSDFLDIYRLNDEIIDLITSERFDLAIALYSDFAGTGYDHINEFVSRVISTYRFGINISGETFFIKPVVKQKIF